MLDKAEFWYEHGQENVALETYQRVLSYDPSNTNALIGAARMGLILGQTQLAHGYIEQLRKFAPKDPTLPELDATVGRRPDQVRALIDARHLAAAAKRREAIAKYKELFDGNAIPDDIAGEYYYLALQEVEDGSVEAEQIVDKMTAIADAHPTDNNYRISLAHCLVLLGDHRPDAIDIYAKLARDPALTQRVRPLWREAILWSGIDIRAREQLLDYLSMFPSDPQLDAIQEKMRTDLPSRALMVILLGNTQLDNGQLAEAEASFTRAMQLDPNEIQGPVMMSVLRMKQGRVADARALIQKAIQIAPAKKDELLAIVGEGNGGVNKELLEEARRKQAEQIKEINRLNDTGHYAEAEALLRKLMDGREDAGSLMMLADIRQHTGDTLAAQTLLLRAVQIAPKNPDANLALGIIQLRAGRLDEAERWLNSCDALLRASDVPQKGDAKEQADYAKKLQLLRQARGELLRLRAEKLTDPAQMIQALRDALAQDPSNHWTSLTLARALEDNTRPEEAAQVMAPVLQAASARDAVATDAGLSALNAAFMWIEGHNETDHALQLARSVPPAKRSEAMQRAIALADLRRDVARIIKEPDAVRSLLQLAAHADPDGARGDVIGRSLLRLSGVSAMRSALAAGLAATPQPHPTLSIRYASLLVEMRQFVAARRLLDTVDRTALGRVDAEAYDLIGDYLATAEVEQALAAHSPSRAEAAIASRGERIRRSTILQTAAARIRIARGAQVEALATLSRMLAAKPGDPNIRAAAIDAAIATRDMGRAADLANEGMRLLPENPFIAMQAAYIARQLGHTREALDDMVKARSLRYEELMQDITASSTTMAVQ